MKLLGMATFFALALSGCMAGFGYSTMDCVTTAAREYNEDVRWGRWPQAVVHVPADQRSRFLERHKTLEDEVEIVDYEMIPLDLTKTGDKKTTRATARLAYTWTSRSSGLVEKTVTDQIWEEKGTQWVVASETRSKGAPLILFDEPAKPK